MHFPKLLGVVALLSLTMWHTGCTDGEETMVVHVDAPYFASLDDVASNSAAIVSGTVIASSGTFELKGTDLPYAQDVFSFRVNKVVGQSTLERAITPGDVLNVSMFALSEGDSEVSNIAELREEIARFSGPLSVGEELTLFIAPLSPTVAEFPGWSVVGSNFGVLEHRDGLKSRAPSGPLSTAKLTEGDVEEAVFALGRTPPPTPGVGSPNDSGQAPRDEP